MTDPSVTAESSADRSAHAAEPTGVPDVSVQRGAIGALQAGEVVVSVGAIGAARAERVSVELGAIGAAAAGEIRVSTASVGFVAARDARFEQALVRTVLAQRVTMGRGSAAGVVIAARVDGDGRPLLDWRGGAVAGTIVALVWLILRRLR